MQVELSEEQLGLIYENLWSATTNLTIMAGGEDLCDALNDGHIQDAIDNAVGAASFYSGYEIGSPELKDFLQSEEFWEGYDEFSRDAGTDPSISSEIAESHIRSEVAERVGEPEQTIQHCPAPDHGFAPQEM